MEIKSVYRFYLETIDIMTSFTAHWSRITVYIEIASRSISFLDTDYHYYYLQLNNYLLRDEHESSIKWSKKKKNYWHI